jgi:hypothetical protein
MKLFIKISYADTFLEDFIELKDFPALIGRDPTNTCHIQGADISRKHAEIYLKEGVLFLRDLESQNGVYLGDQKFSELEIYEGMLVRIGLITLRFSFVSFPLEDTQSFEPTAVYLKKGKYSALVEKYLNQKSALYLFLANVILLWISAPNYFRRNDYLKETASHVLSSALFFPLIIFAIIFIFRKLNRGNYSWARSMCLSLALCLFIQILTIFEKSFCWFNAFSFVWNSTVMSVVLATVFFFWWLLAVAKNAPWRVYISRAIITSLVFHAVSFSYQYLATGYKDTFALDTCYSLTGWHWSNGDNLEAWKNALEAKATKLAKP